jgi:phosphoenolpyruvate carboxylase
MYTLISDELRHYHNKSTRELQASVHYKHSVSKLNNEFQSSNHSLREVSKLQDKATHKRAEWIGVCEEPFVVHAKEVA